MPSRIRVFLLILASLALLGSSASAFALSDELTAVVRHCGSPGGESREISPVTNKLERTLIYNNTLYLHFQPGVGGWVFTTAWNGHLPMTRNELEGRLPCFRTAIEEAATEAPTVDPTIASQTAHPSGNDTNFGIPHFALIVLLGITLLVFIFWPSARQRKLARENRKSVEHVYRKPDLEKYSSSTSVPIAKPIERDIE